MPLTILRALRPRFGVLLGSVRRRFYPILGTCGVPTRRPPRHPTGKVFVQLGGGKVGDDRFVNVDLDSDGPVHYVRRIDRKLPFADGSVDVIYASHCLEHFPYGQTVEILREWRRVLKNKGVLRLSVPNFDVIVDVYTETGRRVENVIGPAMGGQRTPLDFHKTLFTRDSLVEALRSAGFERVREWTHGEDEFSGFDDFSRYVLPIDAKGRLVSLNVQGTRT